MSNFTDFFPAAGGGGGGFTKRLKWTTARGGDDADYNNAASYTVNPATDLGLEDGASIGFFMIGGGQKTSQSPEGGYGGNIIQGTTIITTASTNLVLTPGEGLLGAQYGTSIGTNSTITGGLTITTANGTNHTGFPGKQNASTAPGQGINGYGTGAVGYNDSAALGQDTPHHGFGTAVTKTAADYGSDGAILLFY